MAINYSDRVKETTTTTGTGSLTLDGASTGFQSFDSGVGTGNNSTFAIVDSSTGDWEVSVGVLSSGTVLTRDTVLGSSNSGALVNFSAGTKDVFSTIAARFAEMGNERSLILVVSDETSNLTTGTDKYTFRMPYSLEVSNVRASVTTAPTGSNLSVDVNNNSTSIFSTTLSIDAGEKTSTTAATPYVLDGTVILEDDSEITIDIDAVGSTVTGTGLKVTLIGEKVIPAAGAPIASVTFAPPIAIEGVAYSYDTSTLFTGGAVITYSLAGGLLPNGLSLNSSTGEIAGTPTLGETFQLINIKGENASGSDITNYASLTVDQPGNAPVAVDDSYSGDGTTPIVVSAPGVLTNDTYV